MQNLSELQALLDLILSQGIRMAFPILFIKIVYFSLQVFISAVAIRWCISKWREYDD